MPQTQLNRWATIWSWVKILGNRLPIATLWRSGQAKQNLGMDSGHKGMEPIGGQAMTLINDNSMPVPALLRCHFEFGSMPANNLAVETWG